MSTFDEDYEAGPDGADITPANTFLSSTIKTGTSLIKFDSSQTPAGVGLLSGRFRTSPGAAAFGVFTLPAPTPIIDITTFVRLNTLGGFAFGNGGATAGSLARSAFFQLSGDGGVFTIFFGADGTPGLGVNGKAWIVDPFTASGHQFINADGTLRTDHLYDSAGDFFVAGQDYKVRIVGNLTSFDLFIDDLQINTVPLPVPGVGTQFDTVVFGNSRHTDDIFYDDTAISDVLAPPSGGQPALLVASP